jgi:hypothetical protein
VTGAGSATVAYAVEESYGNPKTNPEWIQPGIDVTVSDLSVSQALSRSRQPDDPTPVASREGNWEGALSLSWTLTDGNFHDLVFADGGTDLPNTPTVPTSSQWYLDAELPDGTSEARTPTGAVVADAAINYQQGDDITVDLTLVYGDEPDGISEPSSIQQPVESDAYSFHGASFSVDGLSQSLMQSATLSLTGLARLRRGQDRHPVDAVVDAIQPSFSTDAIFTERDQLALAVDDVDSGSYEQVGQVAGEFALENGNGNTITYSLSNLQPTSYAWSDLVAPDSDLSEPIEYHVTDVSAVEGTV